MDEQTHSTRKDDLRKLLGNLREELRLLGDRRKDIKSACKQIMIELKEDGHVENMKGNSRTLVDVMYGRSYQMQESAKKVEKLIVKVRRSHRKYRVALFSDSSRKNINMKYVMINDIPTVTFRQDIDDYIEGNQGFKEKAKQTKRFRYAQILYHQKSGVILFLYMVKKRVYFLNSDLQQSYCQSNSVHVVIDKDGEIFMGPYAQITL